MSYRITVDQITTGAPNAETPHPDVSYSTIYEQTVEVIDLPKFIAAVNAKPRKPRVKKEK